MGDKAFESFGDVTLQLEKHVWGVWGPQFEMQAAKKGAGDKHFCWRMKPQFVSAKAFF